MTTKGTLQEIVEVERYQVFGCARHSYSATVHLKCGCRLWYKASQVPKSRARCDGRCKEDWNYA